MSKIDRFSGDVKAFASEYQGTERTTFGTTNESDELTQQQTSGYLRGWGIVGASEDPSLEDFNAAMFTATQYIAYLHQMGVPEWSASQEYPTEGAQVVHSLNAWTRGPDWVLGDEPGVADLTRWDRNILNSELQSVITKRYESTAQVISSAALIVVSHGLVDENMVAVEPANVVLILECTAAESGYSVGDRVLVSYNSSGTASNLQMGILIDELNIELRLSSAANPFVLQDKATGTPFTLTNANWSLYIKAWY